MTWWKQKERLFPDEEHKHKVLIVTYKDRIRAPMLRELIIAKMSDKLKEVAAFRSAGIYADNGEPVAGEALKALCYFGIPVQPYEHETNCATLTLIDEADCLMTVDNYGYDTLLREIGKPEKLLRITDFSSDPELKESKEIEEPRFKPHEDLMKLMDIFDDCTEHYLKYLGEKLGCPEPEEKEPEHWWEKTPSTKRKFKKPEHWWEVPSWARAI